MAEFAASTVAAMKTAGVNRLAIVSAAILFPEKGLRFMFFRWLLRHHARDRLPEPVDLDHGGLPASSGWNISRWRSWWCCSD